MLKTQNRLKKNKQFNYIYKHGEAKHSKFLTLITAKTQNKFIKVGFTVSKKIGKSVVRNKVKRRLRDIFEKQMPRLKKFNYVLITREGIADLTYDELKQSVVSLLEKACCYDNN